MIYKYNDPVPNLRKPRPKTAPRPTSAEAPTECPDLLLFSVRLLDLVLLCLDFLPGSLQFAGLEDSQQEGSRAGSAHFANSGQSVGGPKPVCPCFSDKPSKKELWSGILGSRNLGFMQYYKPGPPARGSLVDRPRNIHRPLACCHQVKLNSIQVKSNNFSNT